MSLQLLVSLYQYALIPVAPFTWFGLQVNSLDLVAAFRLCYVLRHMKEQLRDEHTRRRATDSKLPAPEDRSFVRDALTVLTIVYGGEAIAGTPNRLIDRISHSTWLPSSLARCPRLVHDLRRRTSDVRRHPGPRQRAALYAPHDAQF